MSPARTLQVECADCANSRSFIGETESGVVYLDQEELAGLPKTTVIMCGSCDGTSLIRSWHDAAVCIGPDDPARRPVASRPPVQLARD